MKWSVFGFIMSLLTQVIRVKWPLKLWSNYCLGEWQLIECGPGSGTLMNDILSVFAKFGVSFFPILIRIFRKVKFLSIWWKHRMHWLKNKNEYYVWIIVPVRLVSSFRFMLYFRLSENKMYVKKNKSRNGIPVYWYKNLDDIPEGVGLRVTLSFCTNSVLRFSS